MLNTLSGFPLFSPLILLRLIQGVGTFVVPVFSDAIKED
jgi:hypothetical protein